jgi:23S rRNA (adenine2503-C2)-methyltransferase
MGEGEPFLNYKNVIEVLKELGAMYDNSKLALSTTGIKPHLLAKLGKEKFPVPFKLQISIHSTSEATRKKLMPLAPKLSEIEKYLPAYLESGNALEYNYVLLDGINDADADAVWLSVFAKDTKIKLNMLNPIPGTIFKFTNRLTHFCEKLDEMGANYEFYATDGTDIDAACGQMSFKVKFK